MVKACSQDPNRSGMQFSVSLCALSCFDGTKRPSALDVSITSMTLNPWYHLRRRGGPFRRDKCLSVPPPFTFKVQFVRKFAKSCKIGRVIADRPSNAPSMIDLISQNESVETNALGSLVSVPYSADNGDQWQDNEGGATDFYVQIHCVRANDQFGSSFATRNILKLPATKEVGCLVARIKTKHSQ